MSLLSLAFFLGVMIVLALIPSSSVALVVTRSATHGVRNGVSAALGIAAADIAFAGLALAGMTTLAESLGGFFVALRMLAGAYLIWLGIGLIRARSAAPTAEQAPRKASLAASFTAGFALTLGDLKAIFFYASLFPALFDLASFTATDIALTLTLTGVTVGGVKIGYALLARKVAKRFTKPSPKLRKATGAVLIGTGAGVIIKA